MIQQDTIFFALCLHCEVDCNPRQNTLLIVHGPEKPKANTPIRTDKNNVIYLKVKNVSVDPLEQLVFIYI